MNEDVRAGVVQIERSTGSGTRLNERVTYKKLCHSDYSQVHKLDEKRFNMYAANLRDMYTFDPAEVERVLKEMRILAANGQGSAQKMQDKLLRGQNPVEDDAGHYALGILRPLDKNRHPRGRTSKTGSVKCEAGLLQSSM